MNKYKYPLSWQKEDFFIKIFCSIPNIATGILLTAPCSYFVIDPGDGILRDLNKELKVNEILEISDIFISHGHHDHIGGLWSLLTYLSVMKKETPVDIYYPQKSKEIESIFNAFLQVYQKDLTYRLNLCPIDNPVIFQKNNITIKPFKVVHMEHERKDDKPVAVPSLGFKFTYCNKSICYGGDTAYCETLADNVKDSDLAIIEAGAENEEQNEMHMTIKQAQNIGMTAKEYFLVHIPNQQ
jgi:ribonuclease Z